MSKSCAEKGPSEDTTLLPSQRESFANCSVNALCMYKNKFTNDRSAAHILEYASCLLLPPTLLHACRLLLCGSMKRFLARQHTREANTQQKLPTVIIHWKLHDFHYYISAAWLSQILTSTVSSSLNRNMKMATKAAAFHNLQSSKHFQPLNSIALQSIVKYNRRTAAVK